MIFFECYADEAFLRSLGVTSKSMEHSGNKGKVCKKLSSSVNSIGLVDEDYRESQPFYIQELARKKRNNFEDQNLTLYFDKDSGNKLIVIRPDIESLAIRIASDLSINLTNKYQLAATAKELHKMLTFSKNQKRLSWFTKFFSDSSSHPSIVKIKEFINEK